MNSLNDREKELVALGASLGSNCVPCMVYHVREARKTGLSNEEIAEVVELADNVRRVPAQLVLRTAQAQLKNGVAKESQQGDGSEQGCGCERR